MNLPRKTFVALIIVVIVLMASGIAIWTTRSQAPRFSGPPEQIRLGTNPADYSCLIWVAEDRGYFTRSGLNVAIKEYESGVAAIQDLLADKLEIATAGEFTLVAQSFQRQDLRVLASIDRYDVIRVVARRDQGIATLPDLKGKRIGVVKGSQGEFCLARLLLFNSIPSEAVNVVDLSPSQQVKAIENNEIDAGVTWEPSISKIKDILGSNVVILPAQSGQHV